MHVEFMFMFRIWSTRTLIANTRTSCPLVIHKNNGIEGREAKL
jgi:hypothetical protein